MQIRTVLIIVGVVVGLVLWLVMAPTGNAGASEVTAAATKVTPVSQASTSSRGVSKKSINVVFPVISLSSISGIIDVASDIEFSEQDKAIHLYVNQINQAGGIHGRKINAIIVPFDPTDNTTMRALCQQWTQGNPPVFAVIDGVGTWSGDNELCITQEGHTPMIAAWTTVTDWTAMGSPYLWWTGVDQAPLLQALVNWGVSSGRLGGGKKVGVVVSDQAADQTALNSYLLPDLKKAGITPSIYTVSADVGETAATSSDAQLAVERMDSAGIQSVIPLLPENALYPYFSSEVSQKYYPTLLLSDYDSSVEAALGVIPGPDLPVVNEQEGVTAETLGGIDDAIPEKDGGYDPGVRSCYATWHKAYPKVPKGKKSPYIEEQGPIQGWCTSIRLFADAANMAGPDLNRRTFVTAMSKIQNFPGGLNPVWNFSPTKFYGPTDYQVVKILNNVPPSKQCILTFDGKPQGTCWVSETPFKPLPTSG